MARGRGDKDESDKYMRLLKLLRILWFLVLFVAGIAIGIATSSQVNQYFTTESFLFSSNHLSVPLQGNCTVFQTCDDIDYLEFDKFISPANLSHRMTDEQLFWRASMVPYKEEYPLKKTPKLAFMFLTKGPLPMLPLWERFFKGHEKYFSIYVHALPGCKLNVSSNSPFYGRQIPSQYVAWGTVEMADAEKRLLANALLDFSNDRFILLSESCIPVYNFPSVYKYLIGSKYSFVESYDEPSRYGRGRYSRRMHPDINIYQWRKGSQWFEMQRKLAIYIISDAKYLTVFRNFCKPSCYPDEHYIPTYLNIFHGSLMANRSVTWVDWSMLGPHPAMYSKESITEEFIQSIRNRKGSLCSYNEQRTTKCYLFARKFAPNTLQALLNISSKVMEF